MSEGGGEEPRKRTGLEKQGLDSLRNLIASFSDDAFRPPIRTATKLLLGKTIEQLRGTNFALEMPRRTLWLCHSRTFIPTRPGSPDIDLFDVRIRPAGRSIARLVRKHVFRGDPEEDLISWTSEAQFYHEIAPRIAVPGFVLPQLYGCHLAEDSVALVLEYLEPDADRDNLRESIIRKARSVGGLGAATYRGKLYAAGWIRPAMPQLKASTLFALESLTAHCIHDTGEQGCILAAFENLIGSPDIVARVKDRGYRCLAHGDMHSRNLFTMAGTAGDMAVIDWGNVCDGLIGQDAALFLLPRFNASPEWAGTDFTQAVELVQHGVIAGAQLIDPALDPARIRLGLEIGMVFHAAVLATRHAKRWTAWNGRGAQKQRLQRIAQILRHVAACAETLLRDHTS